jgi:hypothetical protein
MDFYMGDPQGPQLLMAFCSTVLWMQQSLTAVLPRIADPNPHGHGRALHQSSSTQETAAPARHNAMESNAIAALSGGPEKSAIWTMIV